METLIKTFNRAEESNMKTFGLTILYGAVLMAYALSGAAAMGVDLEKPTANLTEHYNTPSGWVGGLSPAVLASAGWTNEALMAKFQGLPLGVDLPQKAYLIGLTNSSDGRCSGDFSKIESVSCDVQVQNSPKLVLYFKSTRGVEWRCPFRGVPNNMISGEWVRVNMPLTQNTNWYSLQTVIENSPDFAQDKAGICEFGFEVYRNAGTDYMLEKLAKVDNVKLIGPWGQPLINNAIPLAWLMENNLSEADAAEYLNVAAMLFGTQPSGSNSAFLIEIGRNALGKTVVKWHDNKYVMFDLLKSSNLNEGFAAVEGETGVMGTGSGREVQVDDSTSGAHFFKVNVRPAQ